MGCVWHGVAADDTESWIAVYQCNENNFCSYSVLVGLNSTTTLYGGDLVEARINCLDNVTAMQYECLDLIPEHRKYLLSIYWAFATMTTVGYGDIRPSHTSTVELIVNMLMQLIGTTIFAYVIGAVMNLVLDFDPATRMLKQYTSNVMEYCKEGNIKPLMTIRAMRQVEVYFEFKSLYNEDQFLSALPEVRFVDGRM